MAKRNSGGKPTDIFNPKLKKYNLTDLANYEDDYPMEGFGNNVEKLYELPGIEDMPGVFLRGIFKNERSLNAHLRLMYRHKKFKDTEHQELLRAKIAGSAAIGGVSRLDALFAAVNLIASDMYRAARGMPKAKKGEEEKIVRGSDYRQDQQKPPDGGLGASK
ncbi:hypothetical protein ES703_20768 [subsurface metagenome]